MTVRTIAFCLLLAAAAATGFIYFKQPDSFQPEADTLVVGIAAGYAPFVSINEQGKYEGFDIDMAQAVATQMGKKLILEDLGSMVSLFTALDQKTVDIIMWGISITPERLQKVAMVHYQGELTTSYPLIFWKEIPDNIKTINDMRGSTVCVEPASSQEAVLNHYPFITPYPTEKIDDALLALEYKKADAALVEPAIALKFKNKYPEIQILNVPLAPEDHVHGIGIVIKKTNTDLIKQVQEAVQLLQINGTCTQLEHKWRMS